MSTSPAPALVLLAAGLGSRFGGPKQLARVGPHGETLMDYSIFDAIRAGFGSVVFVIRPDMENTLRELMSQRYGTAIHYTTAHQGLDDLPPGVTFPPSRTKPWGTAQAVLAAAPAVNGPFAVINADDFYGKTAFEALGAFLGDAARWRDSPPTFGLVGYRVRDTLSPSGGVNRAVIETDAGGAFCTIEEVTDIRETADGTLAGLAGREPRAVPPDALVSMNMWGFTPEVFDLLRSGLGRFLQRADLATHEYLLPTAVQEAAAVQRARLVILPAQGRWLGVTYPEDLPAVTAAVEALVRAGTYPTPLW